MKKIKKISSFLTLILLVGVVITLTLKNDKNELKETNNEKRSGMLSFMVEKGDGTYEEKQATSWPSVDEYVFNPILSKCERGSKLTYDLETNKVQVVASGSDKCYIYFDTYTLENYCNYTKEDSFACHLFKNKDNTLIYHDGKCDYDGEENCNLEAGDLSYRFAGSYDSVNNYVCFGSTQSPCPADNLYRVIGIFNGKVKLIKADLAGSDLLGQDGLYMHDSNGAKTYIGKKQNFGLYCWHQNENGKCASSNVVVAKGWKTSYLNTVNLNNHFYNSFSPTYQKLIVKNNYATSGCSQKCKTNNLPDVYKEEVVSSTEFDDKYIGLMYISDYVYGASPNNWNLIPAGVVNGLICTDGDACNDYSKATKENWLYIGEIEWTISEKFDNTVSAYRIYVEGIVWDNTAWTSTGVVRPVFYLEKSVKLLNSNGNGTSANPYYISSN